MTRSVSARRTLSPTVGPNICAYAARLISWDMALDRFGMVRSENSCGPAALHHGGHGGHRENPPFLCVLRGGEFPTPIRQPLHRSDCLGHGCTSGSAPITCWLNPNTSRAPP